MRWTIARGGRPLFLALAVSMAALGTTARAEQELPKDPYDGLRLENDVLGVRVWGPASQPTLSLGKSDIWDRRWFEDRQPLVTLARIRELAMADRLVEVAKNPNNTVYDLYGKYDFPCPKPAAQVILGVPFAEHATAEQDGPMGLRLAVRGKGKRLLARVWVSAARPLVVVDCRSEGLEPGDFWVRVWRHRDTIRPGEPISPTLGGTPSATDFQQLACPVAQSRDGQWGVVQTFPADPTFPSGFQVLTASALVGAEPQIECRQGERGLGTPLWAAQEGRLDHGVVKRYKPINEAIGAAATARLARVPGSFLLVTTVATTQDGADPWQVATRTLREAAAAGSRGLDEEQAGILKAGRRGMRAVAMLDGKPFLEARETVLPSLRKPGGYYGDIPLCSVGSTKFCFQDAGLWHDDFHLNEIQAEGMLALGEFEELLPYCQMIHTLLAQSKENARAVYGLPGAMYPLVHFPLRCRGVAHTNLTWEQDIGLNGLVTKPLWLYYRYTGNKEYLRDLAYPVLRECARFNAAYLSEEKDGRLHLVPSVSPEHWGLTAKFERNRDATSGLTLTRYLLRSAAAAAEILGQDADEAAHWKKAADRLALYPTFASPAGPVWVDVAGAPPIEYNIPAPLSPVFWGDDVGMDSPAEDLAIARRTLDQIRVWAPHRGYLDSCVRPRLGIYRPGGWMGAQNLLVSYQAIHIFPAVPPRSEIRMEEFAAEGGFRVSAERTCGGDIRNVRIRSLLGGECRVASPWPNRTVRVTVEGGNGPLVQSAAACLSFATEAGKSYRLVPQ